MNIEKERIRITNRHIAKICFRLGQLNLPDVIKDEIKRQMWFLSDDIFEIFKKNSLQK